MRACIWLRHTGVVLLLNESGSAAGASESTLPENVEIRTVSAPLFEAPPCIASTLGQRWLPTLISPYLCYIELFRQVKQPGRCSPSYCRLHSRRGTYIILALKPTAYCLHQKRKRPRCISSWTLLVGPNEQNTFNSCVAPVTLNLANHSIQPAAQSIEWHTFNCS